MQAEFFPMPEAPQNESVDALMERVMRRQFAALEGPKHIDEGIFVANSYTGELFPVDRYVVNKICTAVQRSQAMMWSPRTSTILDLLLAGF